MQIGVRAVYEDGRTWSIRSESKPRLYNCCGRQMIEKRSSNNQTPNWPSRCNRRERIAVLLMTGISVLKRLWYKRSGNQNTKAR